MEDEILCMWVFQVMPTKFYNRCLVRFWLHMCPFLFCQLGCIEKLTGSFWVWNEVNFSCLLRWLVEVHVGSTWLNQKEVQMGHKKMRCGKKIFVYKSFFNLPSFVSPPNCPNTFSEMVWKIIIWSIVIASKCRWRSMIGYNLHNS